MGEGRRTNQLLLFTALYSHLVDVCSVRVTSCLSNPEVYFVIIIRRRVPPCLSNMCLRRGSLLINICTMIKPVGNKYTWDKFSFIRLHKTLRLFINFAISNKIYCSLTINLHQVRLH